MRPLTETIVGRDAQLERLERFLDAIPDRGGSLLLEGEAGIGKTEVWRAGIAASEKRGYRVLRAQPAESERRLSHAAIADLLRETYDGLRAELPGQQRAGLDSALLRADSGETIDPRTIAAGLLSVFELLGARTPVLVAIDDVQWLDRASERALEFAARRLPGRVGLLLSRRAEPALEPPLGLGSSLRDHRLIRLELGPLSLASIHHLLVSRFGTAPSRPNLVRPLAASGGNPFYALEIGRVLTQEVGERALADPLPIPERLHELVSARLDALSPQAREAILVVATLSRPTTDLVVAALGDEAETREALVEAEEAGVLVGESSRLRFSHPLLASTLYASAPRERRRRLHERLALVVGDPEERGRHLAQSELEPNEPVAAELDEAAADASRRGAQDAAAELYEAARRLTPPGSAGALTRRALGEARALLASGDLGRARSAAEAARSAAPAGPIRAESQLLLGEIAWLDDPGSVGPLLEDALLEAKGNRRLRGRIHAKIAALAIGGQRAAVEHSEAAMALLDADEDPGLLAYALVNRIFFGAQVGSGVPSGLVERALELEQRAGPSTEKSSLFLIWFQSIDAFDAARARHQLEDQWYRDRGEEGWQAEKRAHLALVELRAGNGALAEHLIEETCATLSQIGAAGGPWAMPFVIRARIDAYRGRLDRARAAMPPIVEQFERGGNRWFAALALETLGSIALDAADYATADDAFVRAEQQLESIGVVCPLPLRAEPEHVEALAALGEHARARAVLDLLEERGRLLPRRWIDATLPRATAILLAAEGDPGAALTVLEQSAEIHEPPFELARLLLERGRLERRLKRRGAASESLGRSLALFERLGAPDWAERARGELGRVGLRRAAPAELTAGEQRIAELAATGLTNREVAEAAFVSAKTVEANLARAYRKLGIRSRAELGARMAERAARVSPPQT